MAVGRTAIERVTHPARCRPLPRRLRGAPTPALATQLDARRRKASGECGRAAGWALRGGQGIELLQDLEPLAAAAALVVEDRHGGSVAWGCSPPARPQAMLCELEVMGDVSESLTRQGLPFILMHFDSGAELQLRDNRQLSNAELDVEYLRRRAPVLDVDDSLREVLP